MEDNGDFDYGDFLDYLADDKRFEGNLKVAIWNARGFFASLGGNSDGHAGKYKQIKRLTRLADITLVQAAHGGHADVDALRHDFRLHTCIGSFCHESAAGGLLCMISNDLLRTFAEVTIEVIKPGRAVQLLCAGPSASLLCRTYTPPTPP